MNSEKKRIIQITDLHLFVSNQGSLMGVNTLTALDVVLAKIAEYFADFDAFIVTGDLAQEAASATYQCLKERLEAFGRPQYWLPGNHDDFSVMTKVCPEAMVSRVDLEGWQILLLNTQCPGKPSGFLSGRDIQGLQTCLAQNSDQHTLIALHHHPALINSRWMDEIGLKNPQALFGTIKGHSQVKGIIHGHVHQERKSIVEGLPVFATPATSLQFVPESDDFAVEPIMPGFRVLDLLESGEIESFVVRVDDFETGLDASSNGY